jgi:hypothetical protein
VVKEDLGQRGPVRERRGTLAQRASIRRRSAVMVAPGRHVAPHYPGWAVVSPSGEILSLHGNRREAVAAAEREEAA